MASEIEKTSNCLWSDKEKIVPSQNVSHVKSAKGLKSPKKCQECKNDMKIEDVFLNSEYFKHHSGKYHSGNKSSLSFCSGDNCELRWTVDSKCEIPFRRKSFKFPAYSNDAIKSDTAVLEKSKSSKSWSGKVKNQSLQEKRSCPEKQEKSFLEGMSSSERESNDRDLISLITEQMFLAERELEITRTHLVETISKLNERDLEIIQLHEKIRMLQNSKKTESCKKENHDNETKDSSTKTSEDYQRLVIASEKLKKQVKDMEEFLNDYGLVWIGNKDTKPDFDKIIKSFQRLNMIACQPKIIQTSLGAKFELPRGIQITFYANGILLRDNDFRDYNSVSTNMFLQDVEDGFFPSELQSEYPEGVPFEVVDKRNEVYNKNCQKPTFQGHGNRLGSNFEGKPSSVVILEPMKHSRKQDSSSINTCLQEYLDKYQGKKATKRRSKSVSLQDDSLSLLSTCSNGVSSRRLSTEIEQKYESRDNSGSKPLKVKIRYGKDKTESFVLEILENEKMHTFHTNLNRKLCERYHSDCVLENGGNIRCTDFELHIYGKTPFRLSEHLNKYPKECGIVDNCVINVTDI